VVHACVAQAFLCLAALVAVVTSRWWIETTPEQRTVSSRVTGIAVACALAVYLQLVVGALMRHYEAGLAIPDVPLSYGNVIPPTDSASLQMANQQRIATHLPPVTLGQVWLHFGHRVGAIVVSILIVWLSTVALSREAAGALRRPAIVLLVLLIAQITLGILTVLWRKPADVASLHVVTGAFTLMTVFVMLVRSIRLHRPIAQTDEVHPQGELVPA
jgi:cytochrome c oxidase assembly protein subunit 15